MNKTNTSLTKTCSSCGQQKPMSAFLQLAGPQGTTYGSVCASCRKSNAEKPSLPKELEGTITSGTWTKIDSKTKVKAEIDKRELRKQVEEDYFEERDKKDEKKIKRTEKIWGIAQDEKKRIEKRSFLDSSKKPSSISSSMVFGGEEQKAKAGKIDFATGPVENTRVTGQVKLTQSPIFQAFKSWLGNAPIVSTSEKAAQAQKKSPNNKTVETESLDEFANRTWGPRSRK